MTNKKVTSLRLWGKELARAREAAGLNQEDLGRTIHVSQSLVGMWESGRRAPHPDLVGRCEKVLHTDGLLQRLLEDWVSREVSPQWLGKWREAEERATTLYSFQPTVVPGLLQTEEYARTVLKAGRYYREDVEDMVATRMERQKILQRDDPPFLVTLLCESVLRCNVGGPKVMAEQLLHLVRVAESENVVVQVVPFTARSCAGFLSPFVIAGFGDRTEIAYVDNQLSGDIIDDPLKVGILRQLFERFRADALSKLASLEFIRKVVAEQWSVT